MTVSEFAIQMYYLEIIKDRTRVIRDGEVLYDDRMEFLRYAHEDSPEKMWFAGATIQKISMHADVENVREYKYQPDYITDIYI